MAVLDPLSACPGTSAMGWLRQRKGDAEEGTLISPWVSSSFLLSLICAFLPWGDLGRRLPQRCLLSRKTLGRVWLGCFCFMPPGETSREVELYFYLAQALWRKNWPFALYVCDAVLLNCFLSKVHISQCGTFLANQKTLNKYTWIKGSMLIIQTICQMYKVRTNNYWCLQKSFYTGYVKANILENTFTKK